MIWGWLVAGVGSALAAGTEPAASAEPALTRAAQVLDLSAAEAAQKKAVRLRGTVTAADRSWAGRFFLQDETAGVFIVYTGDPRPQPGEVVELTGETSPGAFAPSVMRPVWRVVGRAPLPPPRRAGVEELIDGSVDSQRIEIEGLVRSVRARDQSLLVGVAVAGYRVNVIAPAPAQHEPESLLGARVRVRGTAAAAFNAKLRRLTGMNVFVPTAEDFVIERREESDPFTETPIPLREVAQYHRESLASGRLHVRGIVLHQRLGEELYLQDGTGALRVRCEEAGALAPGDLVEAVGFLDFESYQPMLADAVCRRVAGPLQPIRPVAPPVFAVLAGEHAADLVTLRGRVLDRSTHALQRRNPGPSGTAHGWLLQSGELLFQVSLELPAGEARAVPDLAVGSWVEVTGICLPEMDGAGRFKSLTLLLPDSTQARVLEHPSWFTRRNLAMTLAAACVVLVAVAAWAWTMAKKNALLRVAGAEREQAQRALLAERTRLAQELHDSLEQTLTGIGLQLDTAVRLQDTQRNEAARHLGQARDWLRRSQLELRRSIWDLRSRELEQFDLAAALLRSGRQLADGTTTQVTLTVNGDRRPLPEITEENLLRIGQEALTNAMKHAGATRLDLELAFHPDAVHLAVRDNGRGLDPLRPVGVGAQLGLIGMQERARRIGGSCRIENRREGGLTVDVRVPLAPPAQRGSPASMDPATPAPSP